MPHKHVKTVANNYTQVKLTKNVYKCVYRPIYKHKPKLIYNITSYN